MATRLTPPLSTADYPEQVLVVNVWGSWRAACRAEAPALQNVSTALRGTARSRGLTTRGNDPARAWAFDTEARLAGRLLGEILGQPLVDDVAAAT